MSGTRTDVLLWIENWLTAKQSKQVFWLNGLAGTGKSTIAQTFAETSFLDGKLGASFFCSRGSEDRSNLKAIFPTLAHQLAYRYPAFRQEMLKVLEDNPNITQNNLDIQMQELIICPLKAACIQTLIIIDALDECQDDKPASALLFVLSKHIGKIPDVKFFLTGRPEHQIRSGFRFKSLQPITEEFELHSVECSSVDKDIRLFFSMQLADITKTRSDCDLPEEWPSSGELDILCKKAAGLFIYASTVVKFVTSENHSPIERLADIISLPQSTVMEGRSGIDQLYTEVLEQAFSKIPVDDTKFYLNFRSIIGAVLLMFNPIPINALSTLLRVSNIPTSLRSLHSLLIVPNSTAEPVQVFHKSFPDFLMDPERCKAEQFLINPSVHHQEILLLCLKLMKERLKKNICNLDDYASLDNVEDLSTHCKVQIGDALGYACQFWAKHLVGVSNSGHCVEEVHKAIDEFFPNHFLLWIEVLSLMGILDAGVYALKNVQQWYMLVSCEWCIFRGPTFMVIQAEISCKWINDSQRFLLEHFDAIQDSPSHIYHSALPLCPTSSWLHDCYSMELSQEVKVVQGLSAGWGICIRTVSFEGRPRTHTSWKDLIAVGLASNSIITIDAITGACLSILSVHTGWVESLSFSSDGTLLVSGDQGGTVKLWDVQTGVVVRTLDGHTGIVWAVSISPDHTMIASGSQDKTIQLWDTWTGECCHVIDGHKSAVNSVSFSPTNSQLLISTFNDNTVQWWDVNGHQIGPTYEGKYVTISPDGTYFASFGDHQSVITVQNSGSGVVVAELQSPSKDFYCCQFSPDSKSVACGIRNNIYIWNITNPHPVATLIGHTACIYSITFSSYLISSSEDGSVKLWQFITSLTDPAVTDPESTSLVSAPIKSIRLLLNDGIILSADSAGVVRTWDILTGLCKASFHTPAKELNQGDMQLVNSWLIIVWHSSEHIYILDTEEGTSALVVDAPCKFRYMYPKISGDGSKVFFLADDSIQAWSIQTGELVGKVKLGSVNAQTYYSNFGDGSRVWVDFGGSQIQGWDFEISDPTPIQLLDMASDGPRLELSGPGMPKSMGSEIKSLAAKFSNFLVYMQSPLP